VVHESGGTWIISESSTGNQVSYGSAKEGAINAAKIKLERYTPERIKEQIEQRRQDVMAAHQKYYYGEGGEIA